MACTSPSLTVESYDDITAAHSSGADFDKPHNRRRHSSYQPRRKRDSVEMDGEEGLLLKVRLCQLAEEYC